MHLLQEKYKGGYNYITENFIICYIIMTKPRHEMGRIRYKMLVIKAEGIRSLETERPSASQNRLCSIKLVTDMAIMRESEA